MKTFLNHIVIPWFLLVASLVLAYVCVFATEFTWLYTAALSLVLVCALVFRHNFGKPAIVIARSLIGIVFIFSGIVKAVDPLGAQFQIMDYFAAYGAQWADPLAQLLALGLNVAEILIGIALILNLRMAITAWMVALMMGFFTGLTFLDAAILSDRVSDCGCFGQFLILTPWQTFYKNVVLNIWVVIVFFGRNRIQNPFSFKTEAIIMVASAIVFFGIQIYGLRHLPIIHFLDWRVGAQLNPPRLPITFTTKFQNQETQEIREFTSSELANLDRSVWDFVKTIIHDPNDPNATSIMIPMFDDRGINAHEVSNFVANRPGYTFIVAIHDIERASFRNMQKIFALMDFAKQNGYDFMFLFDSSIADETLENFKQRVGRRDFNAYFSGKRDIMAIVRSNPGLIFIHDGYIRGQWAWRDIPSVKRIQKITQ
ncbi:MAG: DoxX family protein [Bacteroidales bacterium]|nr:DoxX family protein [Bacteroidales bacterium]